MISHLLTILSEVMATTSFSQEQVEDEEFVLLDLEGVSGQVNFPPNAPYVLSGLDTINPVLIIDNKLKLIGEFEETIGTCFVLTEEGKCMTGPKVPTEEVKPIARLHKVLKFSLLSETETQGTPEKQD